MYRQLNIFLGGGAQGSNSGGQGVIPSLKEFSICTQQEINFLMYAAYPNCVTGSKVWQCKLRVWKID